MIGTLTLKQMRDMVARQIGDSSTTRATKIDEWINAHYFDFSNRFRWPQLMRSSEESISVAASSKFIYLPHDVEALYFILPSNIDGIAPNLNIEAMFNQAGATFNDSGSIVQYAEAGEFSRRYDFYGDGEQLAVAQTGYTATSNAYVVGTVDADPGYPTATTAQEAVTVSATASVYVALSSARTFYDVDSFSVETNPSGYYYLKGVTSGTIYAVIPPGSTTVRYRRLRLMNAPASSETVTIYWKRRVPKLISDYQVPEIPVSYALVDKTVATMYSNQREYNAAMGYHDNRGEELVKRAWDSCMLQPEKIEQGVPLMRNRSQRIIVVNPS